MEYRRVCWTLCIFQLSKGKTCMGWEINSCPLVKQGGYPGHSGCANMQESGRREAWEGCPVSRLGDHTIKPNLPSEEWGAGGLGLLLFQVLLGFPTAHYSSQHHRTGVQATAQLVRRAMFRCALLFLVWFYGWKGLVTAGITEVSCKTEDRIQFLAQEQEQQICKSLWNQSNANMYLCLKPPFLQLEHVFNIFRAQRNWFLKWAGSRGCLFLPLH